MDVMKILDLLLVGVPETVLALILGLKIYKNDIFKTDIKELLKTIFRIVVSVILVLGVITVSRSHLKSISMSILASTVAYIITYRVLWGYFNNKNSSLYFNYRKSLLIGSISLFFIMFLEQLSMPVIEIIAKTLSNQTNVLFNNRFILSLPMRILQILLILLSNKFDFKLYENDLLNKPWKSLNLIDKFLISIVIIFIFLSIHLNINYTEMFFKFKNFNIDTKVFINNLQMHFIETIIFMFATLILLFRTIKYERHKPIINLSPEKLFKKILESSTREEKESFAKQLIRSSHVDQVQKLEEFLNGYKKYIENLSFDFDIQLGLIKYDYTDLIYYFEYIFEHLTFDDKKVNISFNKIEGELYEEMLCKIEIDNVNELEHKKFVNKLNQNKSYKNAKNDLVLNSNAKIDVDYSDSSLAFIIKLPIIEYYKED